MKEKVIDYSLDHPKVVFLLLLFLVVLAAAMIPRISIDTDPENMLPAEQADRVFHNQIKKQFSLHDMIVVGVINQDHSNGIFNAESLANLHALSEEIETIEGVIQQDLMSLASVDNISQQGQGTLRFQWMMDTAPANDQVAENIRKAVMRLPLLQNTIVSADGRGAGIYVPIEEKHQSYRIASEIRTMVSRLEGNDEYHITGLPVAEDTFGVEMFMQMAISAPAAGALIFFLMWYFFRSIALITAPMIIAMGTVIITMGLLIGMGYTVHIMSSMIPIFLMPVAVVDSVHLLSEFVDRYRPGDDPKALMRDIMGHLFTPMFFTSVTSSIGFASLALTPIPPVQTFGLFVAFGVFLAFVLTVTCVPAYIVSLSDKRLSKLVNVTHGNGGDGRLAKWIRFIGQRSVAYSKGVLFLVSGLFLVSLWGINQISINDNPVRWFEEKHEIRVADRVLNEHFAGTYNAFLVVSKASVALERNEFQNAVDNIIQQALSEGIDLNKTWQSIDKKSASLAFYEVLQTVHYDLDDVLFETPENELVYWSRLAHLTEKTIQQGKYFQSPEALQMLDELQQALAKSSYVGKTNGLTDLVKTVHRELKSGEDVDFRIPATSNGVAQTLLSFQGSHRPNDLFHFVTPDYKSSVIWLQLKSGDNQAMQAVVDHVNQYLSDHPLPNHVSARWAGLTYINVVWQDAMVNGMLKSLASAFVAVFVVMVFLFRSLSFGVLAMIPLTITITLIYGVIGFAGKDYDMPVAILSSLTLGLSVDFAIHFLERARALYRINNSWHETVVAMFEEPGRAISRNAIVIALGFTPLLIAPLVPYQTVGLFLAGIMIISCVVTLVVLPGAMKVTQRRLFNEASRG